MIAQAYGSRDGKEQNIEIHLSIPCASIRFPPKRFCDFHKVVPSC
jgi:hypothetical protein